MKIDNRLTKLYFLKFYLKKYLRNLFFKNKNIYSTNLKKKIEDLKEFNRSNRLYSNKNKKKILLVCLDNFEFYFFYIWIILCFHINNKKNLIVLSNKENESINFTCNYLNINVVYINEILKNKGKVKLSKLVKSKISRLTSFDDFLKFKYLKFELGKMAISNFCRIHRVGTINFHDQIQLSLIKNDLKNIILNLNILQRNKILNSCKYFFSFEKNLIPYLYLYLYSIRKKKIFVHWSSSNVDTDSFILRKNKTENFYKHHSSLDKNNFNFLKKKYIKKNGKILKSILVQNRKIIKKRYFSKGGPFSVNLLEVNKNKKIKIISKRKKCIIFSHILHDTLYFFGKDIYNSYAEWLIHTVKIAIKNDNIDWYIKFHPSNIYRGEFHKGKSKEEDLIRQNIKELPPHIKFIYPDTNINPYNWISFADFGVTVRGTAGLEMSMQGKPVIVAGQNRYENNGFTLNPRNKKEYKELLINLPNIKNIKKSINTNLSNLYFYGVFKLKCFKIEKIKLINTLRRFNWSSVDFKLQNSSKKNLQITKFKKFLFNDKKNEFFN